MLSGRTKGAFGAKRADSGHSAPLAYVRFGAHRWPRGACRERCSVGRLRHSTTTADAFPCRDRTNIGSKKQCRVLSHRESHRTTHRSFTKKSHRETSAAEGSAGEERMRIRERYELAVELGWSYQNAGRKERGRILDAYCLATGYSRKHGLRVLRGTQQRASAAAAGDTSASLWSGVPKRIEGFVGSLGLHLRGAASAFLVLSLGIAPAPRSTPRES